MGHLLIIGNPLSQIMEFVNAVICSQLLTATPEEVRFVFADHPSYLSFYDRIPHLLAPTVHKYDRSFATFQWLLSEMERRQDEFVRRGVRSYESYAEILFGHISVKARIKNTHSSFFSIQLRIVFFIVSLSLLGRVYYSNGGVILLLKGSTQSKLNAFNVSLYIPSSEMPALC